MRGGGGDLSLRETRVLAREVLEVPRTLFTNLGVMGDTRQKVNVSLFFSDYNLQIEVPFDVDV